MSSSTEAAEPQRCSWEGPTTLQLRFASESPDGTAEPQHRSQHQLRTPPVLREITGLEVRLSCIKSSIEREICTCNGDEERIKQRMAVAWKRERTYKTIAIDDGGENVQTT